MALNLFSKLIIKNLFKKYDIYPLKRLGQNFLIDKSVVRKIIKTAELSENDTVLEIGPGIGNLTQELAKRTKKVIAVEKDKKMVEILKDMLKSWNIRNVKVINADILKIGNLKIKKLIVNCKLKIENYKLVANLPYYITSSVIKKFLELPCENLQGGDPLRESVGGSPPYGCRICRGVARICRRVAPLRLSPPLRMVLMVQKEVAQRICAKPPNMNLLAVSVQFYAEPKIIFFVSKKSFWPQPKVDSAIIKLEIGNCPPPPPGERDEKIDPKVFFRIVKAGFSQPRKQLVNNLSKGLALNPSNGLKLDKEKIKSWLLKNNIQPSQRAETLSVADWLILTKNFNSL